MFVKWRLWFPLFLISSHEAQLFYLHSSLTLKKMRGKCCLLQAGVSWNPSKVGLISQEKRHQLVTHIMASSRLSHQHLPLFVSCGPVGWPRLVKANDLTVLVNLGYNRQFDDYLFEKKKKKKKHRKMSYQQQNKSNFHMFNGTRPVKKNINAYSYSLRCLKIGTWKNSLYLD